MPAAKLLDVVVCVEVSCCETVEYERCHPASDVLITLDVEPD